MKTSRLPPLATLLVSASLGTAPLHAATIYSIDINDADNSVTAAGWTGLDASQTVHRIYPFFRHSPGLTPVSLWKTRVKWLWSANPHSIAIARIDDPDSHSRALARSMRQRSR